MVIDPGKKESRTSAVVTAAAVHALRALLARRRYLKPPARGTKAGTMSISAETWEAIRGALAKYQPEIESRKMTIRQVAEVAGLVQHRGSFYLEARVMGINRGRAGRRKGVSPTKLVRTSRHRARVVKLRAQHPSWTLEQIGAKCDPPIKDAEVRRLIKQAAQDAARRQNSA